MTANTSNICRVVCGACRQSRPPKVTWDTRCPAPKQSYTAQPRKPCRLRSLWMTHRKSGCRFGQGCPAGLSIAKSAEAENAGAAQHSPKQRAQSARRLSRPLSAQPELAGSRASVSPGLRDGQEYRLPLLRLMPPPPGDRSAVLCGPGRRSEQVMALGRSLLPGEPGVCSLDVVSWSLAGTACQSTFLIITTKVSGGG
jgi:hypothetical protein